MPDCNIGRKILPAPQIFPLSHIGTGFLHLIDPHQEMALIARNE
jgi:hypothetical protein